MPDHHITPPITADALPGAALLAFPGAAGFLTAELSERLGFSARPAAVYGELLYYADYPDGMEIPYWCRAAMLSPKAARFDSIGSAAAALRAAGRSWAPYQYQLFRRAALIQEKLPYVNLKTRKFPASVPSSPIGLYTLTGANSMILSERTTSFLPAGAIRFEEDHDNPPSRAYLKLQEALTLAKLLNGAELPHGGQRCLDAGASPGGWTWTLASLGANVLAVDRAPLSPTLMAHPLVEFRAHDAFTLKPADLGRFDWVFSDVICYPERLYQWVCEWLSGGFTENMICTIKLQGGTDWRVIGQFAGIPGSRVVHLNYNKHELTWIHTGKPAPLNG